MEPVTVYQDGFGVLLPVPRFASVEGELAWGRSYAGTLRSYYRAVASIAAVGDKGGYRFGGFEARVESLGDREFGTDARRLVSGVDAVGNGVLLQSTPGGFGGCGFSSDVGIVCGRDDVEQSNRSESIHLGGRDNFDRTCEPSCQPIVNSIVSDDDAVSRRKWNKSVKEALPFSESLDSEDSSEELRKEETFCEVPVGFDVNVGKSQQSIHYVYSSKTERNRAWRKERSQRKKKRQMMNSDWRNNRSGTSKVEGISDTALKDSMQVKWKLQNELASEKARTELEALREERKKKEDRLSDSVSINADDSSLILRKSLEEKWRVQNELAVEKARRELEVLKVSDIAQEVKQYRTKISAATERNMVSIEKTHAKLRETGNLPEERGGGFAETVVSGVPGLESGSGTISPDSSASMAEFRACQKALLDAERENAEYKRKIKIASEKYGFPLEQVDFLDKEVWTDTQTNQDILDEIYPNGYGKDTSLFEDGKFRAIGV